MPPVFYDEHIVPTMNTFITYYIFFTTIGILMNVMRFLFDHYFLPENHDMQMKVLEHRVQLQENIMEELIRHLNSLRRKVEDRARTRVGVDVEKESMKNESDSESSSEHEKKTN